MELQKEANGQDVLLDSLRRAIIQGQIPPGGRIVERDLAVQLGVSRTPVREALARLRREGLISAAAGRQRNLLAVSALTVRQLHQTSAATAVLEGIGAALATAQPKTTRIVLTRQLEAMLNSAAREMTPGHGGFARALELDERFHRALADGWLESSVRTCLESVRAHVYRYVWMFSPKTGLSAAAFKAEHAPIIAALRKGDAAGIRAALEANWMGFATRITPFLEDA